MMSAFTYIFHDRLQFLSKNSFVINFSYNFLVNYKILSLFANVGIAETLLDKKKFKTVVFSELLQKRAAFYKYSFKNVEPIIGDISKYAIKNKIIKKSIEKGVDFIMATPPCQGFSVAGKRRKDDPRNRLIFDAIDVIKEIKPKYVFIENVSQYFSDKIKYKNKEIGIPEAINDIFKKDYIFKKAILDTKDYGVPQQRKRGVILLSRKDVKVWNFPKKQMNIVSVREAIGHLPSLSPIVKGSKEKAKTNLKNHKRPIHNIRHIIAMKNTPSGKSAHNNKFHFPKTKEGKKVKGFSTTYKRISWDKPAPTITMMNGSISSQNNVHPGRKLKDGTYSDPRVLTLREIFILSTLPPEWNFPKWASDNLIRQVIGEGIPPLFVKEIFNMISK